MNSTHTFSLSRRQRWPGRVCARARRMCVLVCVCVDMCTIRSTMIACQTNECVHTGQLVHKDNYCSATRITVIIHSANQEVMLLSHTSELAKIHTHNEIVRYTSSTDACHCTRLVDRIFR